LLPGGGNPKRSQQEISPMNIVAPIRIAILGAGKASRFGGGKVLAPCGGKPLGQWALETALQTGLPVDWIAGESAPDFTQGRCIITHNPRAAEGIGTSVALAAELARESGADALLIMLADMPLVSPALLARLLAAQAPAAICHADGRAGVPALIPAAAFPALAALTGDRGAGPVLKSLPGLTLIDCDPALLLDVDSPGDLVEAARRLEL